MTEDEVYTELRSIAEQADQLAIIGILKRAIKDIEILRHTRIMSGVFPTPSQTALMQEENPDPILEGIRNQLREKGYALYGSFRVKSCDVTIGGQKIPLHVSEVVMDDPTIAEPESPQEPVPPGLMRLSLPPELQAKYTKMPGYYKGPLITIDESTLLPLAEPESPPKPEPSWRDRKPLF